MVQLSIIIPTFDRSARLRNCLEALIRQTLPAAEFEVIVVVDGSTDGTWEMLAGLRTPFALVPVRQENRGQNAALNRGLSEARGEFCLFLDDDIVAEPEFLEEHLRAQRSATDTIGIGRLTLRVPADADWFVAEYAASWAEHYAGLDEGTRAATWMDCFGGNMSAPREALLQVGGVAPDIRYGHDTELAFRLHQAGLRFRYLPRAVGHQDEQKDFRALAFDAEKNGVCWVEICARHPAARPHLLGSYHHTRWRSSILQWLLLTTSAPPAVVELLLRWIGKSDRRAFHFLRNLCYWRGIRRGVPDRTTWRQLTGGTRVLMYHAFGERGEAGSTYVVPIQRFSRQLAWLKRLGFNVITLEEYLACRHENRLPPPRALVITIDDGYADLYRLAFPVLVDRGFPATVFLVSAEVGGANRWSRGDGLQDRPMLSWTQVHEMRAAGIRFGAHTRTHPDLTRLPPDRARQEMEGSRSDLERKLGEPVRAFAFPFGESDATTERLAYEVGFLGSCGIEPGVNTMLTPLHALRRTEIFGTDSLPAFLVKVLVGPSQLLRYM